MIKKHKKLTDPTNNRKKVIMYGCVNRFNDGTITIDNLKETRAEAVKASKSIGTTLTGGADGICKVEMLVPSLKNQWTITVDETCGGKIVRTRKFTLETVSRPIVWGTSRLSDEAVQAYIDTYIGDDPKEADNFRECNGTANIFRNARSPQVN